MDFYSGFVYICWYLVVRVVYSYVCHCPYCGRSAHRMEELINTDKIIRPAYKNVLEEQTYEPLKDRR